MMGAVSVMASLLPFSRTAGAEVDLVGDEVVLVES